MVLSYEATKKVDDERLSEPCMTQPQKIRRASIGKKPTVLADIYQEETNIAIWQRDLPDEFQQEIHAYLVKNPELQISISVSPENTILGLREILGKESPYQLHKDIAKLVTIFCSLFELKRVGLRLTILDRAMCPRFHVDRVPARLVTTYQGAATQWLPHAQVNRQKLGAASRGKADEQSGLFQSSNHIKRLRTGDIAILKGELWEENENAGLVHRSPQIALRESRLLLTLDFND